MGDSPLTLPADYNDWDNQGPQSASSPETLPAGFSDWDKEPAEAKPRVLKPALPKPTGPVGFDEAHPILSKVLDIAGPAERVASQPISRTLGLGSFGEVAEKYLPPPASGGIKGAASDVARNVAGLADFLQSPTGLAAAGATALSGGTAAPVLAPAFAASSGVETVAALKAYRENPNPENLQRALMAGGLTALMSAGIRKPGGPLPPAPEARFARLTPEELLYTRTTPQGQIYNETPAIGEDIVREVLRRQPPPAQPEIPLRGAPEAVQGPSIPRYRPTVPTIAPAAPAAAPASRMALDLTPVEEPGQPPPPMPVSGKMRPAPPQAPEPSPTTTSAAPSTQPRALQPQPAAIPETPETAETVGNYPGLRKGERLAELIAMEAKFQRLDPEAQAAFRQAAETNKYTPDSYRDELALLIRSAEIKQGKVRGIRAVPPPAPEKPAYAEAPGAVPAAQQPPVTPVGGARALQELGKNMEANQAEIETLRQQITRKEGERRQLVGEPPTGIAERRAASERRAAAPIVPRGTMEEIAAAGGGKFHSIQEGIPEAGIERLIQFDDEQTRSTLALPESKFTAEAVRAKIAESRAKYAEAEAAKAKPSTSEVAPAAGKATTIQIPGGEIPAAYDVVEASSLQTSHNPFTFAKNPAYPEGVQERQYHTNRNAQADVMKMAAGIKPDMIVNTDPTAVNGPPQTTPEGVVLGGNARAMALRRAYQEGGAGAYRQYLSEHAADYGLDPGKLAGMKEPVLIRRTAEAPPTPEAARQIGRDLNRSFAKPLSEVESAVSAGKNISQGSAEQITAELTKGTETATLRDAMAGNPALFRDVLLKDKVLSERDLPRYFSGDGSINAAGKDFIENALLGRVVPDAELLQSLPKSMTAKLERSIPALIDLGSRNDAWNIMPEVIEAAKLASRAQAKGWTLEKYLSQGNMFERPDPRVRGIAELMLQAPTKVAEAFGNYARQARAAEGKSLFEGAYDPVESFQRIIQAKGVKSVKFFERNTIFTKDTVQKDIDLINKKTRESGSTLGSGLSSLDPELVRAYARVGAAVIEAGVRNFAAWSGNMVDQFGERVQPHLEELWRRAVEVGRSSSAGPQRAIFTTADLADRTSRLSAMLEHLSPQGRYMVEGGAEAVGERGTVSRETRGEFYGPGRPGYQATYEDRVSVADLDRARNALLDAHAASRRWLNEMRDLGDESAILVGQSAVRYLDEASRIYARLGTTGGRVLQSLQRRPREAAGLPQPPEAQVGAAGAGPGLGGGRAPRAGPGQGPARGGPAAGGATVAAGEIGPLIQQVRALIAQAEQQIKGQQTFKQREPITTGLVNAIKQRRWVDAAKFAIDQRRLNLFSPSSWTLDLVGNTGELGGQTGAAIGHDVAYMLNNRKINVPALRGMASALASRWRQRGVPLDPRIEEGFGYTVGGEILPGGAREIPNEKAMRQGLLAAAKRKYAPGERGVFTYRKSLPSRILNEAQELPLAAKGAMDTGARRLAATAVVWREAIAAADKQQLTGAAREAFYEQYWNGIPDKTVQMAIETGNKAGFNRPLSKLEDAISRSKGVQALASTYPRWTFQFTRHMGEMLGYNPEFLKQWVAGKTTPEEFGAFIGKTATGWAGLMLMNTMYDRMNFRSMEMRADNGDPVRLSGREPLASAFVLLALIKGDLKNAAAGLKYASYPGAETLGNGGAGGVLGNVFHSMATVVQNPGGNPRAVKQELERQVNDSIPARSLLGLVKTLTDPTQREGIGANLPGVSFTRPARVNPTTGEPLSQKQRIPGTHIEFPAITGVPVPGLARVTDPVEKLLTRYNRMIYRGPRQPVAGFPAADIPGDYRREWEQEFGHERQRLLTPWAEMLGSGKLEQIPDKRMENTIDRMDSLAARRAAIIVSQRHGGMRKPPRSGLPQAALPPAQ